jgi:hypothetical protein
MLEIIEIANQNEGFIALLTFVLLSILVPVAVFAYRTLSSRITSARTEEEINRIEKIRAEFYSHLKITDESSGFGPFLIRDVDRDRLYFDGDENEFCKKGAPPSFKVCLVDTSVHGIRVYHGMPERIKSFEDGSRWCLADESDEGTILAHPVGEIPFSSIIAVNWYGDPATHFPHIYCRFDHDQGWPYKKFEYCERAECMRGWPLYIPRLEADKLVRKRF